MPPTVSIIIPTYNRRQYLPAAIASVQQQTVPDWQLIVVDDGSTDGTAEVVEPYIHDSRFQYVALTHQGRSAARNHGAALAQAEWLAFLDSDDCYLPRALEAHLAAQRQHPQAGLMLGGYEQISDHGARLDLRQPWREGGLGLASWVFNCLGTPGSALVRRDWFERVHGFDPSLEMAEDWDLFLRLACAGCPMEWTRASVYQYREHAGSSVRQLALHRDSSLIALDKVFRQLALPAEVGALEARAKAWVYLVFAQRAFAAGCGDQAVADLTQALALDPDLAGERRGELLEMLFRPERMDERSGVELEAAVTSYLPPALKRRPAEVRAAQARAHMALFFKSQHDDVRQASAHLNAALRRDPRWLLNRGVLAYCLRQSLRGAARP